MRPALGYLVNRGHRQAGGGKRGGSTARRDQGEADRDQVARDFDHRRLVFVSHADEGFARARQTYPGGELGFDESLAETRSDTHYLAGGFHFRAEDGVDSREFDEGEYRGLHREIRRHDF